MANDYDPMEEIDNDCVIQCAVEAWAVARAYHEWIERQLRYWIPKAEAIEPTLNGMVGDNVRAAVERMKAISYRELPEVRNDVKEKDSEVRGGAWSNVLDARAYLQQGCYRYEKLVEEILQIRKLLESLWDSD